MPLNPVVAANTISANTIFLMAEAGEKFVTVAFAEEQQREIEALKTELRIAIGEACNDYWNKGHFDRVFKRWGSAVHE